MNRPPLLVAFHRGASLSPKVQAMEEAVIRDFPSAVFLTTSASERTQLSRSGLSANFSFFVNGDNERDALKILRQQAGSKRLAVVTLNPELIEAANEARIPVVTVGMPSVLPDKSIMSSAPQYLGKALRDLQNNR